MKLKSWLRPRKRDLRDSVRSQRAEEGVQKRDRQRDDQRVFEQPGHVQSLEHTLIAGKSDARWQAIRRMKDLRPELYRVHHHVEEGVQQQQRADGLARCRAAAVRPSIS